MDRLAKNAMLAKQAGMSYGKWKALQPITPISENKEIPKGWKKCLHCGKAFKPYHKSQRYCDLTCREEAYKTRAAEIKAENMRKYRERKAEDGR